MSLGDAIAGEIKPIDFLGISYGGSFPGFNFVNSTLSVLPFIVSLGSSLVSVLPEVWLPRPSVKPCVE